MNIEPLCLACEWRSQLLFNEILKTTAMFVSGKLAGSPIGTVSAGNGAGTAGLDGKTASV
jgi:hypothetical protein